MTDIEPGPFESNEWPEKLKARVTDPGPPPRLHGYDVEEDLARHYRLGEVQYLALTGELPDPANARAFEAALVFACPAPVGDAPAHAALLAQRCGADASAVVAVAATGLAEEARYTLDEHVELLAWLDAGSEGDLPPGFASNDDHEDDAAARLGAAAGPGPWSDVLRQRPRRMASVLSVLHGAGLRERHTLEAALVGCKLWVAVAEAFAAPPGHVRDYPQRLPDYRYEETP